MKPFIEIALVLASVWLPFAAPAEAINIALANVQNGLAVVEGNQAAKTAPITWDGVTVTRTTNGGSFAFSAAIPWNCIGSLSDGVTTIEVALANCAASAPAPVPQTGQTISYLAGDDGTIQAGVPAPTPRFTDNSNGTVTDNLTGLIWLKNANCPSIIRDFSLALSDVASLNSGGTMNGNACGDTSNGGGHQSDWRLPNVRELFSLLHFGFENPHLSNTAGTGVWQEGDPFTGFYGDDLFATYWSSTSESAFNAWVVDFDGIFMIYASSKVLGGFGWGGKVLPVRGPRR